MDENDHRLLQAWSDGKTTDYAGTASALESSFKNWLASMNTVVVLFETEQVQSMAGVEEFATGRWVMFNGWGKARAGRL